MVAVKQHTYQVRIDWTGNDGTGTSDYCSYRRDHSIIAPGKPASISGSSDPAFRGDAARYSPEELLVASLSSCHMLWYLHLCSTAGVVVLEYQDNAQGAMREEADGSGAFAGVELRPTVRIADAEKAAKALALHEVAHRMCFIARSVNFPVSVAAEIAAPPLATRNS